MHQWVMCVVIYDHLACLCAAASQGHFYSFHLRTTNTLYVFPESNTLNLSETREIMSMICVPVTVWDRCDCSFFQCCPLLVD